MMNEPKVYTFEDVATTLIPQAAHFCNRRFRFGNLGADLEDFQQEMNLWVWGHESKVRSMLSASPQRTTRLYRSLLDLGIKYGEKCKAATLGYDASDVFWYTPAIITELLSYALMANWEAMVTNQTNPDVFRAAKQSLDLYTMVADVRSAIERTGSHEPWDLADALNDMGKFVGSRKAISNAAAIAVTKEMEGIVR